MHVYVDAAYLTAFHRITSRVKAIEWLKKTSWIGKHTLSGPKYIEKLAESRFAISPTGNGVQSPKQMEVRPT